MVGKKVNSGSAARSKDNQKGKAIRIGYEGRQGGRHDKKASSKAVTRLKQEGAKETQASGMHRRATRRDQDRHAS